MTHQSDRELLLQIAGDVGEVKGRLDSLVGSPDSIIGNMQADIDKLQTNDTILKWVSAIIVLVGGWLGFHSGKP